MDVVINELYADAPGADDGEEWVELYNAGPEGVVLDGWSVWSGTSALAVRVTLSGSLDPAAYLVVGGPGLTLGNAGSSADAVALVDPTGAFMDTVVYGAPNTDAFLDDLGSVATSMAPAPVEGLSVLRSPDGQDSDDAGLDFILADPTPGAANPAPLPCASSIDVVINEILPDPPGDDEGSEWVELYNRGGARVSLAGWTLTYATSGFDEPDVVFGDVELGPGAFLLVGGAQTGAAVITDANPGNGTGTDAIRLTACDGAYSDTVLYGEVPNADALTDDGGAAGEPYGDPASGQSLARWVDGQDTDRAPDWRILVLPTPGESNPPPSPAVPEEDRGCSSPSSAGCGGRPSVAALAALGALRRRRYLLARAISSRIGTSS